MTEAPGRRNRVVLPSASAATAYQRTWFADLKRSAESGTPVALVNADAPQEILRALGIPYIVNQWWASLCAAKQKSGDYLRLLGERGYPTDQEQYNTLALASTFDADDPPWGGLPPISLVLAETTGDALYKVFEAWERERGATFLPFARTVATDQDPYWWRRVEDDWEALIGTDRIALMTDELVGVIRYLETFTGRVFDEEKFVEVMALVNEQQLYNRLTRDLIATTTPAPITISDSIPSVMIPQWHRGTAWARDAAKTFYEEVRDRVETRQAPCQDEQIRLMWVGTGLWFDMGFYTWFQEKYGAVFVWSMYLAIAADGYIRNGADPLRALAGRFAAFPDMINAPPWASEWYAKEAVHNRIDGAIHFAGTDRRGNWFVNRAIEAAGVPVLQIDGDSGDARGWDPASMQQRVAEFIENRVAEVAAKRRAREAAQ